LPHGSTYFNALPEFLSRLFGEQVIDPENNNGEYNIEKKSHNVIGF
jgi:hypothetical protein